jgi:hypothetical protein
VLHLTRRRLRGTVTAYGSASPESGFWAMRDLLTFRKLGLGATFGAFLGAMIPVLASVQTAQAANALELNFWLSGPKYDGRVAPCEKALSTISYQFQEKESMYWNSRLEITAYGNIHEIAFRPWESDNIPRRYCTGKAQTSDGKIRTVNFSIIEDGGFSGFDQGIEWCVSGLDRNWAYNPACTLAGP